MDSELFTYSVQSSSVTQPCPTLCDPMDCSTPGLPVHHQLPELAQTPVHWIGDASQPSSRPCISYICSMCCRLLSGLLGFRMTFSRDAPISPQPLPEEIGISCDSWSRKESDTAERLNWTELRGRLPSWLRIRFTSTPSMKTPSSCSSHELGVFTFLNNHIVNTSRIYIAVFHEADTNFFPSRITLLTTLTFP